MRSKGVFEAEKQAEFAVNIKKIFNALEENLKFRTFFVSKNLTVVDFLLAVYLNGIIEKFLDTKIFVNVNRWYRFVKS